MSRARTGSLALGFLMWLANSHARAHEGTSLSRLGRQWTLDPWLLAILAAFVALYVTGERANARRRQTHAAMHRLERAAFALCACSLVVALCSPLDALSDVTFSAHMTQHELLMLVAAPLLVLARPLPVYLRALPLSLRSHVAGLLRRPLLLQLWRSLTAPVVALLVHGLIRWLWHLPSWFQAALANEWVHGLQHFTFFVSAALFWWGLVHGRYGRAGYGLSALFVLLTGMHTGALGALLSFSQRPWYPAYEPRLHALGIDPVLDQQLAGLIMWVGAFVWLLMLALALFLAWLGEARRRVARGTLAQVSSRGGA